MTVWAFDIDGTITSDYVAFGNLMASLMAAGDDVHVITSALPTERRTWGSVAYRREQLDAYGVFPGKHYSHLHIAKGETAEERGKAKAKLCQRHHVSMMFEDDPRYAREIERVCTVMLTTRLGYHS